MFLGDAAASQRWRSLRVNRWVAAALGFAALVSSPPASAESPATANSIQVGLGARYGIELDDSGHLNIWGTGIGVDGGYTLPNAIHVGADADYFFGDKEQGQGIDHAVNVWQAMAHGGYDLGLGNYFVLRPKVGIGPAGIMSKTCRTDFGCASHSETHFALAPGAAFILVTPKVSATVDVRYDMIFDVHVTFQALVIGAGVGF
jgi:Outer membrane protein beta-barrel domain